MTPSSIDNVRVFLGERASYPTFTWLDGRDGERMQKKLLQELVVGFVYFVYLIDATPRHLDDAIPAGPGRNHLADCHDSVVVELIDITDCSQYLL